MVNGQWCVTFHDVLRWCGEMADCGRVISLLNTWTEYYIDNPVITSVNILIINNKLINIYILQILYYTY